MFASINDLNKHCLLMFKLTLLWAFFDAFPEKNRNHKLTDERLKVLESHHRILKNPRNHFDELIMDCPQFNKDQEQRFTIFKQNLNKVIAENEKAENTWVSDLNCFSLAKPEELSSLISNRIDEEAILQDSTLDEQLYLEKRDSASSNVAPEPIDYRTKTNNNGLNILSPASNQGGCISTYAWSAVIQDL